MIFKWLMARATGIKIATGAVVQLAATPSVVAGDVTAQAAARTATTLELLDFEVIAYNSFGGTVTDPPENDSVCSGNSSSRW